MGRTLTIRVIGDPKPGGSKRVFINKKTGKAIVTDDCKQNKTWRACVANTAIASRDGLLYGQLDSDFVFIMPRPKRHFGKKGLKPKAPYYHTNKPDLTKLIRSTEDALTGIVWTDDSQVVMQQAIKRYANEGEAPGCIIKIKEINV